MEKPIKPNRLLDRTLSFDEIFVAYVEWLDYEKLKDLPIFDKVRYIMKASKKVDTEYKTDLLLYKGNFQWEGLQLKNDSDSLKPDYTFHLRDHEINALLKENHGAKTQIHIIMKDKRWEELGLYDPDQLEISFLVEVDLQKLATVIHNFEFTWDNDLLKNLLPLGYHRAYDPWDIEPGEYKIRYYNHHDPDACNRYVVYKDWDTKETKYIFKWHKQDYENEWEHPFIRIPYMPLLTASHDNPLEISKVWMGNIPEIEYIRTTKNG